MAVTINCPSCGGEVAIASRASRVASCPFCNSTLIVNAEAIRSLGKMALLAETPSSLAVGWPARCKNRDLRVLGRLQYRYDSGLWDEWWIQFADDGSYAWISQDEGEYTLETPLREGLEFPDYDSVHPGDTVPLGGRQLQVQEKNHADMAGLQGEVPLEAGPGKPMRYLDLADNKVTATIEYFDDGTVIAFQGKHLKRSDLESEIPIDSSTVPTPYPPPVESSPSDIKPTVVRSLERLKPLAVTCPSCAGTVEVYDRNGAAMVMCSHCGSAVDVTVPGRAQLLYEAELKKRPFPIEIGSRGKIRGVEYVATGIVRYKEIVDEGVYEWTALQLFNPDQGYAFLELENGHWLFFQNLKHPVALDARAKPKQTFNYQGQTYTVFENSACRIVYVEGELSWVARLGDVINYIDAIRPPYLLSREWTEQEVEWSLGVYMTPDEVCQAFGLPKEKRTRPVGVAPAQPFERTKQQLQCAWAGMIASLVLFALMFWAWTRQGTVILSESGITDIQYLSEAGYVTRPFEVPEGTHICKLAVSTSGLNNSWVAMSVAILDEEEKVVLDADATVEEYSGTEGGESWSEGSPNDEALVRMEGGTYRLNIFGESGTWSQFGGDSSSTFGPPLTIRVERDVMPVRYFLFGAIIAAIYPIWEFGRQAMFQGRRWSSDD